MMAKCGKKRNESRNLHNLIHRQGRTYPVNVTVAPTRVRILRGKPRTCSVNCPVLLPSSWLHQLLLDGGQFVLGGHSLLQEDSFRPMFKEFWRRFKDCRPDLDLYKRVDEDGWDESLCIPISLHGDEGRGKARRPIMVISIQPVISHRGPEYTNSSGWLGRLSFVFCGI